MRKTLLYLIAIILGIYIAICAAMYFFQDRFIFFPTKLPADYSFQFSEPFEELFFQVEENAVVHGLLFGGADAKGVVIYFHGNAGSLADWGNVAGDFTALGYDILVIDYRGYGKSTGQISEKTLLHDAQFIYDEMKKRYGENRIVIYGRSIGSGIAACVASQNSPSMLVLETPYYSFIELVNYHMRWLPNRLLLRYKFPLHQWLSEVNSPAFIFHGTRDEIIPFKHSQKLVSTGRVTKLIAIEGGTHNDLSTFMEYHDGLKEILN